MSVRCVIVDDNVGFLAASRRILDGGVMTVVGEAGTAAEALQRVHELSPDLVLLDIDLGEDSGLAVARELAELGGGAAPKVILISAHPHTDFAELIAESPAIGFLEKSELSPAAVAGLLGSAGAAAGDSL